MRALDRRHPAGLGRFTTAFLGVLVLLASVASAAAGQQQQRRVPAGYTAEQADAGFEAYRQRCAVCHGANLDDGPFAPPLRGAVFRETWLPRSVEALFRLTAETMPQDLPGTLDDETVTALVALMLQENGVEPGAEALPSDPALMAGLSPGWSSQGGGLSPGASLPPWPAPWNPLDAMQPVTDEMLHDPPADDWLLWRRTYGAYGFSPLNRIDTDNVADLRVAWSWALPQGPNESTPIVHDGVLFVHGYGDRVQALNAANGDFLWQYTRRLPRDVSPSLKRGMSIHGDRLFVPTSDAHVVALDAKTGDVVWDTQVGDLDAGLRMTGGTLVARGKVMVGTMGRHEGGNYVVALDVETGEEAWRFGTIPAPDDPGGHTWNGIPHVERNGASVWIPGSYDPASNLAFFGTGNTYDTAAATRPGRAARHEQRRVVPRRHARPEPRHRRARLALPAPGQRAVGPRLGVRTADRGAALRRRNEERRRHHRQAGDLRLRGDGDRQVRLVHRPRPADRHHLHRPGHRPQDPGPDADSGRRRDQAALPARRRRQKLAADRL